MPPSHTPGPCSQAVLARSPLGQVAVCPDCGVVHLSLQCLSIRLEPGAFEALALMVAQAQQRLGPAAAPAQPTREAVSGAPTAPLH